jgi:hypothetical protein
MNRNPLPYPPQMRNGGLPPAHLPSPSLSNPSVWLQYKWSQPPPCAPDWVCDAPDDWISRALREDQQATGVLPPKLPGGPFYMGLAPARNMPTGIGSGRSTNCGRTSAIAYRRRPTNAILTRKPLVNARRPINANNSSTSVLPTNARRPPVVNGFSTRRLRIISAFLMSLLLVASWPNALLLHDRWRQPEPSSSGFAAAAYTSGSPDRLCGNSNVRPLLHVCDTSRTAARARRSRRSSVNRQLQCERRLWPARLTSGAGRTHWPQSNAAESRPNALRRRQSQHWPRRDAAESRLNALRQPRRKCWLRSNATESRPNALRQPGRMRWPRCNAAESWPNALRRRRSRHWPRNDVAESWQIALR